MRAIVRDRYGPADVLALRDDVQVPEITDDEVLVRVHAAGLDRGTEHLMTGKPYLMRLGFGLRRPKNPVSTRKPTTHWTTRRPRRTPVRTGTSARSRTASARTLPRKAPSTRPTARRRKRTNSLLC